MAMEYLWEDLPEMGLTKLLICIKLQTKPVVILSCPAVKPVFLRQCLAEGYKPNFPDLPLQGIFFLKTLYPSRLWLGSGTEARTVSSKKVLV